MIKKSRRAKRGFEEKRGRGDERSEQDTHGALQNTTCVTNRIPVFLLELEGTRS